MTLVGKNVFYVSVLLGQRNSRVEKQKCLHEAHSMDLGVSGYGIHNLTVKPSNIRE